MRLNDISIKKKLVVIFLLGMLVVVAFMLLNIRELRLIGGEADILSRPRQDTMLLAAEVAHLQWASRVQSYLLDNGETTLEASLDGIRAHSAIGSTAPARPVWSGNCPRWNRFFRSSGPSIWLCMIPPYGSRPPWNAATAPRPAACLKTSPCRCSSRCRKFLPRPGARSIRPLPGRWKNCAPKSI